MSTPLYRWLALCLVGSVSAGCVASQAADVDQGRSVMPVSQAVAVDSATVAEGGVARRESSSSTKASNAPEVASRRGWSVSSVVDGDTLWVTRGSKTLDVRIIGINTPEKGECLSKAAARALRSYVQDGPLRLVRDVSSVDQYGRALRYVHDSSGRDVGARLVRRGLALARRYPPDTARADTYDRLQARAERSERGLWSPTACGGPTTDAQVTITVRADALGDDNYNLNDEWVQFTNVGSKSLDLSGWIVADESASHRYTFTSLALAAGKSVTLFTGCGADTATVRHWCNTSSAVWNNDSDTVFLRDPSGNLIASQNW